MNKKIKTIILIIAAAVLLAEVCFIGIKALGTPEAETPTVPTEAPTAAPTAAPTEEPTEAPTEAPTELPTEPPTEAPTEPPVLYRDPLTGEPLDAPVTSRIFAFSINNEADALPHVGTQDAGIVFEMYVNGYVTRCLALYTDITKVEKIGPIRSMRQNFTDICVAYDAFMGHASGSDEVMQGVYNAGIDHIWVATSDRISYRDKERLNSGYAVEHTLFVDGPGMYQYLVDKEKRVTASEEDKTYGLNFVEDGTPTGGEDAGKIDITFRIKAGKTKLTTMTYNEELGRYVYTQYGRSGEKDDPENFENVFVMLAQVNNVSNYHVAELTGSGDGYYACNGKIIPIKWHHEKDTDPITFTLTDGTPLEQGIGNSYIAIVPLKSTVEWE